MSLQWSMIAGFLCVEVVVVLALILPFLSSTLWHKLFKSRFLRGLESQLKYYFYVLVVLLLINFLDAIREMQKYSSSEHNMEGGAHPGHLDTQMQSHMKLFRAQRNFYISGFALFLCLVINRLVGLISRTATLEAEKSAAMKQAESASRAAEALLKGDTAAKGASGDDDKAVDQLKKELMTARKEVTTANASLEAMKNQAKSLTEEYDRLLAEKDKLERKLAISGGEKKDD